jgi:signal recognition particle subunit SRP54
MPGGVGKKSKGRAQKSSDTRRSSGRGARSGNPAKRAAQAAEAEQRRRTEPGSVGDDLGSLELPAEFRDLLPPSR